FFFIDFSKSNELDAKNKTQDDYLTASMEYLNRSKVFGDSTDAIYIILTKADLINATEEERQSKAEDFLNTNFANFITNLKLICKEHSINSGKLLFKTFSIGDIYFENLALLDEKGAETLLNIFYER